MAKRQKRMLRQIRRNNVAVLWNHDQDNITFERIPKARKSFLWTNWKRIQLAKVFLTKPHVNPVTGFATDLSGRGFRRPVSRDVQVVGGKSGGWGLVKKVKSLFTTTK